MDKAKLKIGFVDFIPSLKAFFTSVLSEYYELEIDNNNPDFLFFSTEEFGTSNKGFDYPGGPTKILFTGENRRPEAYSCNYAISFDHQVEPWHYRLPLYAVDMWCINVFEGLTQYPYNHITELYNQLDRNKNETINRDKFCGFVHRNGSNGVRNQFFQLLNNYKPVTSAGPLFNNTGYNAESIEGKIDFFKECKFALCFENSSYPGYVTEKILHAFYAGAIPIYWGSPTIGVDFNQESFIDAGKVRSLEDLVNAVREVDTNDDLYQYMLNQPKTMYNIPNECVLLDRFLNWFDAVVVKRRYPRNVRTDIITIRTGA